jgi:methyltransferase family protein
VTHFSDLLTGELDAYRERTGRKELAILETGSIRNAAEEYHQNDGWSTLTFAQYVQTYGGSLTSVDLDISAADVVLTRHGLRDAVNLVQQHSISFLAAQIAAHARYDVILLDSANDAELILYEYLLAKNLGPGLVLVDDVEPGSTTVVKGHALLPVIEKSGTPWRMLRRTGAGTFSVGVLAVDPS